MNQQLKNSIDRQAAEGEKTMEQIKVMYECIDCGHVCEEGERVNPGAHGDDYYVEGYSCPKCGGDTKEVGS